MTEEFDTAQLIGKTLQEASDLLEPLGYTVRPTKKNGSPIICTRDYKFNRLNVEIDSENKIIDVVGIG